MYPSYCFDNDYIKTTSRWRESSTHFFCKCGMLLIGKHGVIDVSMTRKAAAAAVHLKGSLAGTCRDHCTGGHRFAGFATQRRAPDPDFRSVTVTSSMRKTGWLMGSGWGRFPWRFLISEYNFTDTLNIKFLSFFFVACP